MGKLVLGVIGLVAAIWTWQNVHPLVGIVIGFLFVGGAGWYMLGGLAARVMSPSIRRHWRPFVAAWERPHGPMEMGVPETYPPQGAFQAWHRECRRTGISPEAWLDRNVPLLSRHVALHDDGHGATFHLLREGDGHTWRWAFDPGVDANNLHTSIWAEDVMTEIERELGLPLTWKRG